MRNSLGRSLEFPAARRMSTTRATSNLIPPAKIRSYPSSPVSTSVYAKRGTLDGTTEIVRYGSSDTSGDLCMLRLSNTYQSAVRPMPEEELR